MNTQTMKRVLQFAAAGSVSLMIGGSTIAGLFHKCDKDERCQINPACHPTYGYHQTCWRRFPPLPPCNNCESCQTGQAAPLCQDGSCQPATTLQPPAIPLQPHPEPVVVPGTSDRYGMPHSSTPLPPVQNLPTSRYQTSPSQPPQPVPGFSGNSGRYQAGPGFSGAAPVAPLTGPPSAPLPPQPAPTSSPANGSLNGPAGLPAIPGNAPRSSGLYIPSQSMTLPGGGRYGRISAPATQQISQPTARPQMIQVPVHSATHTTSGINHRYPIRPRPAETKLLAAPLLKRPGS